MKAPAKPTQETPLLPDGRYFSLTKVSFSEARLSEYVIRGGKIVSEDASEDLSRIQLGKLLRRVGENWHEDKP